MPLGMNEYRCIALMLQNADQASPLSTSNGKHPPAAPVDTYSVILGVDTKSPGEQCKRPSCYGAVGSASQSSTAGWWDAAVFNIRVTIHPVINEHKLRYY